ncbi:MAG: hypothetical protein OCD00_16885 [Colwellia sp.]
MKEFDILLAIARRKKVIDQESDWSNGANTYLTGIKSEIEEVIDEIPKNRSCYLEEELGDILWDYLNILINLERESGINVGSVLKRTCNKYEERISGVENGESWQCIKVKQKVALENEQSLYKNT